MSKALLLLFGALPVKAAAQVGALAGHVIRLLPMVTIAPLAFVLKRGMKGRVGAAATGTGTPMLKANVKTTAAARVMRRIFTLLSQIRDAPNTT